MGPTDSIPFRKKSWYGSLPLLKNASSSAGFEPGILGSSGKHATTRPPMVTLPSFKLWSIIELNEQELKSPDKFML
jgi:hypothetical protein